MLVLSRKVGEVITIGPSVTVTVLSFDRGVIRLGIEAPKDIQVHRKEVYDKIIQLNRKSAGIDVKSIKNAISESGLAYNEKEPDKLANSSMQFKSKK